jgi:hypothetical protein
MVKVKTDITGWKMWEHGVPDSRLTVLHQSEDDYVYPDGRREARWVCECNCKEHNQVVVRDSVLKHGSVKSCGCLCKEQTFNKLFIDMTGWVMSDHGVPDSRLTVIKRAEDRVYKSGTRRIMWLCECNCEEHNMIVSDGASIRNGGVKSCGCLHKEKTAEKGRAKKKYNKKDLSGEYGIIWSTNTNEEIYFDLEDADKVLKHAWMIDSNGYPSTNINRKPQRMHVFLGFNWHDHHNQNKLDNRKENFVPCTRQENVRNSPIRSNNSSGITGVYKHSQYDRWVAQIKIDDKPKHLGVFANKKDAIKARLIAEKQYFGDFAPQRHLFKEYGII